MARNDGAHNHGYLDAGSLDTGSRGDGSRNNVPRHDGSRWSPSHPITHPLASTAELESMRTQLLELQRQLQQVIQEKDDRHTRLLDDIKHLQDDLSDKATDTEKLQTATPQSEWVIGGLKENIASPIAPTNVTKDDDDDDDDDGGEENVPCPLNMENPNTYEAAIEWARNSSKCPVCKYMLLNVRTPLGLAVHIRDRHFHRDRRPSMKKRFAGLVYIILDIGQLCEDKEKFLQLGSKDDGDASRIPLVPEDARTYPATVEFAKVYGICTVCRCLMESATYPPALARYVISVHCQKEKHARPDHAD
ncbi:hypothetical protein FB567DRAFT_550556 [Paraphoma chrysanthemicola]|uniref:Uncharacterized protein n=1 Tax=Paraphoma chrysanthemicola TaxID=798071 RepID=A0A8K0VX75_9PLEO|nr:hypothetical protein FB567DRAFT_550556 [Paraphoma chrysanthemicola]